MAKNILTKQAALEEATSYERQANKLRMLPASMGRDNKIRQLLKLARSFKKQAEGLTGEEKIEGEKIFQKSREFRTKEAIKSASKSLKRNK